MPVYNPSGVEVRDEGVSQGVVHSLDFTGAGVTATVSGDTATVNVPGGGPGGGLTLTTVETSIGGGVPQYSGTFDITSSGLTPGKPVLIQQAAGPYTGKGDQADEAEMDQVLATAYVVNSTTIRVYWVCPPKGGPIRGNIKFNYAVSA